MVGRRYLRTKVMQALYAFENNNKEDFASAEKKLDSSIRGCYTLFLYLFSILPECRRFRSTKLELMKEKIHPTENDLNPNTKFVENVVCLQIEDSPILNKLWDAQKINWTDQKDIIISLYQEISANEYFINYMSTPERSYAEDKKLILRLIEEVLAPSELLHWFLEEKNVHWFDDYNEAMLMVYRNVETFKESQGINIKISPLFNNEKEETDFYRTLFSKTLLNNKSYEELIIKCLKNWEIERLMVTDIILMKMAICEFTEFPSIPVKVTINEYIELAKLFSSSKSGTFINGMLDNIVSQLKIEDKLNKIGRGLIS